MERPRIETVAGVIVVRWRDNEIRLTPQQAMSLTAARQSSCLKVRCRVDSGSLMHIQRNTYSVHSRLRGEWVEARLFADRVEVWYADQHVDTLPRLVVEHGRGKPRAFSTSRAARPC
jgi:hypothetical protein